MKILQIIDSLGTGGAEKLLLETVPLYRKAGLDMDVLLLWDNDLEFAKKLKSLNCCEIYTLKKSENSKDIYKLSHIPKIRRIIKNYDLIHVHLFPASYFTAIANIGIGKKLIFTEHNTSNNRIKNPKYRIFEKWCYSRYQKLICITEDIKNIYQDYLGLAYKSVVIPNGVNLEKVKNALPYQKTEIGSGISDKDVLLIQVAGFRPQKDQDTAIRALGFLPAHYKLLLAGDGEREQELKNLSKKLNLTERVIFLGQRMDIPELLKTSDFLVLSSHHEGLSLSAIEGLASGKPFIASDVPGLREQVKDAGFLFPKGDEKALAGIILDLAEHPEKQKEMSERGIKRAAQYDIHKMVERHIELYQDLMAN